MKNIKLVKLVLAVSIYFIVYLTATIFQSDFWGNILSPIGALISLYIIIYTCIKSEENHKVKTVWMLYGLSSLSWAFADILWALCYFIFKTDPEESSLITFFYALPSILMCISILISALFKLIKRNLALLMLDIAAVSASCFLMLWILFFNRQLGILNLSNNEGLSIIIIIFSDITALLGIFIWSFSCYKQKISIVLKIVSIGLFLYFTADLYYYYLYLNNIYIPNSVIDAVYMASLLIIPIGINHNLYYKDSYFDDTEDYISTIKHNSFLLFINPVLIIIFKGFIIKDLLIFLFIILIHEVLTSYVKIFIKNQNLLSIERELNTTLEYRIAERTRELTEKNKELDFLVKQDTVTTLYNRRYFINMLNECLLKISPNETLALLFIDLDRFKTINDTYGHNIGDKVLIEISKRLQKCSNDKTCLARLGGDEFVFSILGEYYYREAENFAEEIIKYCSEPIKINDYVFNVTLSIGISIYPIDADDSSMLMKNADIAMYQAKASGYNKYLSFNSGLSKTYYRRNEIEILLRKADFSKEFMLLYQPQFSLPDKKLIGAEALLRWNCPEKGFIPPAEFIPIAEETDLIIPIGNWVLKEAIKLIGKWNNSYLLNLKMGINVSPKQLDSINFIKYLISAMESNSVNPKWIDIEITEGIAIGGELKINEIADMFKDVGVSISIDDFGTGYSSLSYLKLFPFDRIKIAKPLVDNLAKDSFDLQIVKAIIKLSKSIGIKNIAEGVEFKEQLDILTDLGCEEIQGYYLGKPITPEEFEKNIINENWS